MSDIARSPNAPRPNAPSLNACSPGAPSPGAPSPSARSPSAPSPSAPSPSARRHIARPPVARPLIPRRGVCLVLSAPSGAGKTAITEALLATDSALERSVSVTTRQPRPNEVDGVHYHFITEAQFQAAITDGDLLEWARVLHGAHAYGTPRVPVEAALADGRDVVFDIDWQGHRLLRQKLPNDVVSVFILPPDMASLELRLRRRAGDVEAEIDRRMRVARDEISHWSEFDHVVVNDDLSPAIASVRAVLHAARLCTARQLGLERFVAALT